MLILCPTIWWFYHPSKISVGCRQVKVEHSEPNLCDQWKMKQTFKIMLVYKSSFSVKFCHLDLFTVHNLMVLSSEADINCFPSGVKAIDLTAAVWPFQNVLSPVILGIQIANEPSWEHEAIKFPAGEKETSLTPDEWPANLLREGFEWWVWRLWFSWT